MPHQIFSRQTLGRSHARLAWCKAGRDNPFPKTRRDIPIPLEVDETLRFPPLRQRGRVRVGTSLYRCPFGVALSVLSNASSRALRERGKHLGAGTGGRADI